MVHERGLVLNAPGSPLQDTSGHGFDWKSYFATRGGGQGVFRMINTQEDPPPRSKDALGWGVCLDGSVSGSRSLPLIVVEACPKSSTVQRCLSERRTNAKPSPPNARGSTGTWPASSHPPRSPRTAPRRLPLWSGRYNSKIDMWSLGCILAELFLGLPLFPGVNDFNQMARIVEMCKYGPVAAPPTWLHHRGGGGRRRCGPICPWACGESRSSAAGDTQWTHSDILFRKAQNSAPLRKYQTGALTPPSWHPL